MYKCVLTNQSPSGSFDNNQWEINVLSQALWISNVFGVQYVEYSHIQLKMSVNMKNVICSVILWGIVP